MGLLRKLLEDRDASKVSVDLIKLGEALETAYAVAWFDREGSLSKANPAFHDLFGFTKGEILGRGHDTFLAPEESSRNVALWADFVRGNPRKETLACRKKDGTPLWVEISYMPLCETSDTCTQVIAFARDVTEDRVRTLAAEASLAAFRSSHAVAEFDMEGNILSASEIFLEIFGYRAEDVKGRHHAMFLPAGETRSDEHLQIWADLASGTPRDGEFQRMGQGGRTIWIHGSYTPVFDPDGTPSRVVQVATDITARTTAFDGLTKGLSDLAAGHLPAHISDTGSDAFTPMRQAFNATVDRLGELITGLRDSTDRIAEETDVIATSVQNLSSRNEQQAARVEETSAAMTQMETAIQSNAENTNTATTRAGEAVKVAENGSSVVGEAVASMKEIEESARNIRRVNEVIDSIAFQTNLLALNAGVEAARAGDAGRGFAVVASEVRALAQRAAEAARDINDFVQNSHEAVSRGSALVGKSGEALREIVTSVSGFASNMQDISNATSEQAQGISSVRQAISDIDITTQRTAAIAEESAAAAIQLADRTKGLRKLMATFDDGHVQSPSIHVVPDTEERNVSYLRPQAKVANGWSDF